MTEKQFKKDEVIFREGATGDCLYKVIDGTVGIVAHYGEPEANRLTELKKDQFFGEMAVIEVYPRSATAVALDDVKVAEISAQDVVDFFKNDTDTVIDIMKHLSSRLRELTNDYTEVSNTIADLHLGEAKEKRSESLADKIKKFANIYKNNKNTANITSVETLRKIDQVSHSEGYTGSVESYSKGTIIFKEGETGNCMYDVHFGRVGVYKDYGTPDEKLITEIGINKFFGEMGMLEDDKRSATVVVLDDETTIESIYEKDLKDLFANNPPKVEMIMAHLSYRLRRLTNEYVKACKLIYDVSDAEASGSVSDELKQRADSYQANLYD